MFRHRKTKHFKLFSARGDDLACLGPVLDGRAHPGPRRDLGAHAQQGHLRARQRGRLHDLIAVAQVAGIPVVRLVPKAEA